VERAPYRWGKTSAPDSGDVIELRGSSDHGDLEQAVRDLDRRERARSTGDRRAASVLLAGFAPDRASCSLAHMGDARAYLYRPAPMRRDLPVPLAPRYCPELVTDRGGMVCVTWDHSTACDLVEMELLSLRDGRRRARRRVLTRGLGAEPATDPDLLAVALQPGDRLLLCSAGLWLAVDDAEIAEVLAAESDPDAACRALVDRARDRGGDHPASALLVDWSGAPARAESAPPALPGPLASLGRDLTALAAGDRSPLAGRKRELRALIRTLLRMQKPNALLVGDPGVGKTWLVQALARTLASPACPKPLAGARVVEISIGSLLAGTRYRGDFEERLQQLIDAAEADRSIILFIDEIHLIAGAGAGSDGGVDAANILKPALARGTMRVIGATTGAELDRHLVRDDALMRRFEVIRIDEPSRADALAILSAVADQLEAHHGSTITAEAREAAIDLSVRYLPDRRLPDKAIDLLDQACTRAVSRWLSMSLAPSLGAPATGADQTVAADDVAAVIADRCQLPIELVSLDDDQRLAALPGLLADRVIGQPAAIETVARALQRGYRGLGEPGRPIASMLFCGPTGVGKTSLARAVAELLFDSEAALIRIDMSEYMERHAVSRLLGAAPGYVGHDQDGQLLSALRARPASVVLFDEIEKAHPDVLQILLQILDAGWLKGGRGTSVSFRDSVVILTSNLLADATPPAAPIGFGAAPDTGGAADEDSLRRRLERSLPAELIGRLGAVVRFAPLSADTVQAIAERHLARVVERLIASGTITAPPRQLRDRVTALTRSGRYGARTIERAVEEEVVAWLDERDRPAVEPGAVVLDRVTRDQVTGAILVVPTGDPAAAIDTVRTGPSSADLCYLVHAGIGALAIFGSVASATAAAEPFDRAVVHWGRASREGGGLRGPDIDRALDLARKAEPGVELTPQAREHG
jgi:ATP-dependent Clp protease ATP-binding subunit ClpC